MKKSTVYRVLSLSLTLCLVCVTGLAAQERLATKQLAGPIEEMRSGVMAEVNPVDAGIHSKSAMIPVDLTEAPDGTWRWQGTVAVDGDSFSMILFSGRDSWTVGLGQGRALLPARQLAARLERTTLEMGNASFEGDSYQFTGIRSGDWTISVETRTPLTEKGYLLYSSDSAYRMLSQQTTRDQLVGRTIGFVSSAYKLNEDGGQELSERGMLDEAWLRVTMPNGKAKTFPMFDDGLHGDQGAGDGIFGGSFRASRPGDYHAQVITRGTTLEGTPFVRTAEHLVPVIAPGIELARDIAAVSLVGDTRARISLDIHNADTAPTKYRVFAEVWGADARGQMQPVNWIGGMTYVDEGRLNLGLDLRWIGMSQARGTFELRNVRIEDPDTFIPVLRVERLPLSKFNLPVLARTMPAGIDAEMLMGPRPQQPAARAAGGKLLLVHGYCSGNVWGGVSGQFSNYALFLDTNQNRSHDTFAYLIGTFGAAYPSFGIVAHSQGGAASLHLYTYYWSGLDYAGAGRLIQSVGTPYQGTSLAGNLAALGEIFGAGCGSNYDLTYSGAASWLSGIPTWARGATNYYTTSFEDKWWRYDYCHIASDLLLSDPDDGTTEKAYGQLSYAYNRGHKTNWCHTSGMRDPAQTTDSARNSSMNSYAAR